MSTRTEPRKVTPLREILALHDADCPPHALPEVLGDGHLLAHDALYRRVRELCVAAGVRFTADPPFDYRVLPLLALDELIAHRQIPYVDNVAPLRALEERHSARFGLEELIALGLPKNNLLHESVHLLVRERLGAPPTRSAMGATRRLILDRLFEESCANAVEAVVAGWSTGANPLLIQQSCFLTVESQRDMAGVAVGTLLRLLVVAFLHANFLWANMDASAVANALALVLPARVLRDLGPRRTNRLFRLGFRLSVRFRAMTTPSYLKLAGIEGSIFELLDFAFVDDLRPGRRCRRALEQLVDELEAGVVPSRRVASVTSPRARSV